MFWGVSIVALASVSLPHGAACGLVWGQLCKTILCLASVPVVGLSYDIESCFRLFQKLFVSLKFCLNHFSCAGSISESLFPQTEHSNSVITSQTAQTAVS